MNNFKKRNFGGRPSFDSRSDRPAQMFTATCAQCHKECEVPFRPNGSRPVYCRECFGGKDGQSNNTRRFGNNDLFKREQDSPLQAGNGAMNDIKTALSMINIKLDRVLSLMSKENTTTNEIVEVKEDVSQTEKPTRKRKVATKK